MAKICQFVLGHKEAYNGMGVSAGLESTDTQQNNDTQGEVQSPMTLGRRLIGDTYRAKIPRTPQQVSQTRQCTIQDYNY